MATTTTIMPCPVCRAELVMAERQGIEIDICPNCRGVWLDRGELDKIVERGNVQPRRWPSPRIDTDDFDDHHHGHRRRRKSFLSDLFD